MDEDFQEYVDSSKATSTKYSETSAYNSIKRYMVSVNELREPNNIPPSELSKLLCNFYIHGTKLDGNNFEPNSLSTISRGLQRYLFTNGYGYDIIHDDKFAECARVLKAKRKILRKSGKGNCPNATRELEPEEVDVLFRAGYFSIYNAESLIYGCWWLLSLHYGFRARDEARKLKWGDLRLGKDFRGEYLEWTTERGRKTRTGDENENKRVFDPKLWATSTKRCPVMFFKEYAKRRPSLANTAESPFFLAISYSKDPNEWYMNRPMGKNKLGGILTNARKRFEFQGKKVSNHTVRKTGISRLLDANVQDIFVAQHAGMANVDSLKSYKSAGNLQIAAMSDVLSRDGKASTTGLKDDGPSTSGLNNEMTYPSSPQVNVQSNSQSLASSTSSMFSGKAFQNCQNCTFNFNMPSSKHVAKKQLPISSSSDSE